MTGWGWVGGLKSVPQLGSLCLQPPGPGPLLRGVTLDTKERAKCLGERGPEESGALTKMCDGGWGRGGAAMITRTGEGLLPPTTTLELGYQNKTRVA